MKRFDFIYLASQSPRRAQLLAQIGVAHELLLPGPEEDAEALELRLPKEPPADYVQRVTLLKLAAARRRWRALGLAPAPILCADTTVALGQKILGKPADAADAAHTLAALAGRTHDVLTAVAVGVGRRTWVGLSRSRVDVAALTPLQIQHYIATGEPFGKAGAYAIQGALAAAITRIAGSHSGIMGLPLHETAVLLQQAGVRMALMP